MCSEILSRDVWLMSDNGAKNEVEGSETQTNVNSGEKYAALFVHHRAAVQANSSTERERETLIIHRTPIDDSILSVLPTCRLANQSISSPPKKIHSLVPTTHGMLIKKKTHLKIPHMTSQPALIQLGNIMFAFFFTE